jgi:hypothetical protein
VLTNAQVEDRAVLTRGADGTVWLILADAVIE